MNRRYARRKFQSRLCQILDSFYSRSAASYDYSGGEKSVSADFSKVSFNQIKDIGESRHDDFFQTLFGVRNADKFPELQPFGFFKRDSKSERDVVRYVI